MVGRLWSGARTVCGSPRAGCESCEGGARQATKNVIVIIAIIVRPRKSHRPPCPAPGRTFPRPPPTDAQWQTPGHNHIKDRPRAPVWSKSHGNGPTATNRQQRTAPKRRASGCGWWQWGQSPAAGTKRWAGTRSGWDWCAPWKWPGPISSASLRARALLTRGGRRATPRSRAGSSSGRCRSCSSRACSTGSPCGSPVYFSAPCG